jgi:hypothetical protein
MSPNALLRCRARRRLDLAVAAFVCAFVVSLSPRAYAEGGSLSAPESEPASPDAASAASVARTRAELGAYAEQARRARLATNITTLAAAAILIPAGSVLWSRADPLSSTLGPGMALGGAIPLLFMPATLFPSKMERLRKQFDAWQAAGASDPWLLQRLDTEWEKAARSAHKRRVIVGAVDLTLGAAALGTGLFFLLADPVANMDHNGQFALGSSLAGTGLPVATFGVRSLIQKSLEETSWEAHCAAWGLGEPVGKAVSLAHAGVVPLRGGAAAVASFSF